MGLDYPGHYLLEMAKKHFRPEFVNRVNDIIVFRKLTKDDLKHIVQLELTFNYHPSSLMHARIRIMLSSFLPSLPTKERLQ